MPSGIDGLRVGSLAVAPAAPAAKITGDVKLRPVVEPDGHVDRVSVTESLDSKSGLDDEAIKAARRWEVVPSRKRNKPVAVWIEILMQFRL
jgi:TonB family protein